MIACLDVDYKESQAQVACILFKDWSDETAFKTYTKTIDDIHEYIPGQFYKRELPCITEVLNTVEEEIDLIVVDGYVWLKDEDSPGLGAYLFRHLDEKIPVIGVAKNQYKADKGCSSQVLRGESKKPLFITAAGINLAQASKYIQSMHGKYRFPTLLKLVDQTCRG